MGESNGSRASVSFRVLPKEEVGSGRSKSLNGGDVGISRTTGIQCPGEEFGADNMILRMGDPLSFDVPAGKLGGGAEPVSQGGAGVPRSGINMPADVT